MDKKISLVNLIAQIIDEVLVCEAERLNKLAETVGDKIDSEDNSGKKLGDKMIELEFQFAEVSGALEQVKRIQDEIMAAFQRPTVETLQ